MHIHIVWVCVCRYLNKKKIRMLECKDKMFGYYLVHSFVNDDIYFTTKLVFNAVVGTNIVFYLC